MRCPPPPAPVVVALLAFLLGAPPAPRRAAAEPPAPSYLWGTPPACEPEDSDPALAWLPAEPEAAPHSHEGLAVAREEYREEPPEPVRQVIPEYPPLAREAEIGGRVVTDVRVGTDGRVLEARVEPGHSVTLLDDAALEAVRQWVFRPARANRTPVAVWVAVPFHFRLR